jgi:Fe-S oxidoreductase
MPATFARGREFSQGAASPHVIWYLVRHLWNDDKLNSWAAGLTAGEEGAGDLMAWRDRSMKYRKLGRTGLDIAEINKLLDLANGGDAQKLKAAYQQLDVRASQCLECGDCVQRCPFGVDVIERLKQAVEIYE